MDNQILDGPSPSFIQRRINMLRWIFNPLAILEKRYQQYGDVYVVAKNVTPLVVYISNPEALQQIFSAPAGTFDSSGANRVLLPLLGDRSLILLDGVAHQRQRKLLMPPFHGDRLKAYGEIIRDITQQVISRWEVGKPFNVRASMQEISLRVILSAVFGLHQGDRFEELRKLLTRLLDAVGSPISSMLLFFPSLQKDWGVWSPWGRFLNLRSQIDQLIYAEITARRAADVQSDDILSLLLQARDEHDQPMTDRELRDELVTLLFAGHETTASALSWALYWIDHLPEVREKLLQELDTLPPDADPSAVVRLLYLNAVCCETLRIYPIAINTFPRIVRSPIEIMGYHFEPGTLLLPSVYLTHHREDLYPEPKRFKPERFLERQFSPYEYLPFGGGNRRCIGLAFAQFEMKLVLATILAQYDLQLATKTPIKPTRRGLTVAPSGNLRMVVKQVRVQKTPALVE
ncbi:cytochrome P450 [Gloeocapsa sp. BRSZ]